MASRVFVDANVLLEIILKRDNQHIALKELQKHSGSLFISALTGHLCMYFGSKTTNTSTMKEFLEDFKILPLDESSFGWAFINARDGDFEDALQLAVAVQNGCDLFVTFDKKLAATYSGLPVLDFKLLS